MNSWNIPNNWKELFSEPEQRYHIHDSDYSGDNNYAMEIFLDELAVPEKNIVEDWGTQVYLSHPDYDYQVCIDSSGDGDFHLHGYDITRVYGEDRILKQQQTEETDRG